MKRKLKKIFYYLCLKEEINMILTGIIGTAMIYIIFRDLKISMNWMRDAKEYWK